MKRSKWFAGLGLALVMGMLLVAGRQGWSLAAGPAEVGPAQAVSPTLGPLRDVIIAKGTVAYGHQLSLRAQASGRVAAVMADEGTPVRRGQPLLRIEDPQTPLDAELHALEETRARAKLDALEKDVLVLARLLEAGALARFELDQKALERDLARKELERAATETAKLGERQRQAQVSSPVDGLVITRAVVPGQWVTPGDELVQVAGGKDRHVVAYVDAMDVERLRVGLPVVFSDQEDGGKRRRGQVAELGRAVAPAQGQRQNAVKVEVRPLESINDLRVSQQLYVEFVVLEDAQALRVPKELVYDEGGRHVVYVATPQGVRTREVSTARGDVSFDKVLGGLDGSEALVRRPVLAGGSPR